MLRFLAPFLLAFASLPALAQESFDGTWSFVVTGQTEPLLILDLEQVGTALTGAGVIPDGTGAVQAGNMTITQGATVDGILQAELLLRPQGETAIFTVIPGQGATLEVAGAVLQGSLERFGGSTPALPPAETELTAEETCASMEEIQREVILQADNAQRRVLRRIYDDADARFGQEQTQARCAYLLAELSRYHDTDTVVTAPEYVPQTAYGSACDDVAPVVAAITADLAAAGLPDDGTLGRILDEASLGEGGLWTTGACEYGLANLLDYQAEIVGGGPLTQDLQGRDTTTTTVTVKDPALPAPQVAPDGLRSLRFQLRDVSGQLNMRAGPGTDFGVTFQLPASAQGLVITGQGCSPAMIETGFALLPLRMQLAQLESRWCEVEWTGTRGWVAARYLSPM